MLISHGTLNWEIVCHIFCHYNTHFFRCIECLNIILNVIHIVSNVYWIHFYCIYHIFNCSIYGAYNVISIYCYLASWCVFDIPSNVICVCRFIMIGAFPVKPPWIVDWLSWNLKVCSYNWRCGIVIENDY